MTSRLLTTITACGAVSAQVALVTSTEVAAGAVGGYEPPSGYVTLVDDTNHLTVAVPEAWDDVVLEPASVDGVALPRIHAATDRSDWDDSFGESGVLYTAHPYTNDPQTLADEVTAPDAGCSTEEQESYDDGAFVGEVYQYEGCGEAHDTEWHVVVASPASEDFTVVVNVRLAGSSERPILDVVLESFNIVAGATWPLTDDTTTSTAITTSTATTTTPATTTTSPASTTTTPSTSPSTTTAAPPTTAPSTSTTASAPTSTGPGTTVSTAPTRIVDDTNLLTVTVPGDWVDVLTAPGNHDDGSARPTLSAAPDFDRFLNAWDTPGIRMVAVPATVAPATLLANHDFSGSNCTLEGPSEFNNGRFFGQIQRWVDCPNNARLIQIAAQPTDGSFTLFLELQEHEELSAATQTALSTFGLVEGATYPAATPPQPPTTVGAVPATLFGGAQQPGAVTVIDDTSTISVAVPAEWNDTDGAASFNDDFTRRPRLFASPDVDNMMGTWLTPGVQIAVFPYADPAAVLGYLGWGDQCTDTGVQSFDNGVYTGYMIVWANCGETETRMVSLAMSPSDQSVTIFLEVQLIDADDTPLQTVLSSVHLV